MATNEEIAKLIARKDNKCFHTDCQKVIYDADAYYMEGVVFQITDQFETSEILIDGLEGLNFENCVIGCQEHYKNLEKAAIEILKQGLKNQKVIICDQTESTQNEIDTLAIEEKILRGLKFEFPPKKVYDAIENYIPRKVFHISESYRSWVNYPSLGDLVETESRIVLLGVAGFGKSIELQNVASHLSKPDSIFYPVLIRLKDVTSESIEGLIDQNYPQWRSIPKRRLVLVIDALDEVSTIEFSTIVSKINTFTTNNSTIRLVVSCRNNFYSNELQGGGAKLAAFRTYQLTPIDYFTIRHYLSLNLDANIEELLPELTANRYFELLESPFYLVRIIEYHNQNHSFPKSRSDLFEYLIKSRFEKDRKKFVNAGINLEIQRGEIRAIIEKIAILMLCIGRDNITNDEVGSLFPKETQIVEALKRSFLFDLSIRFPDQWEFEHNQFKEFLAACFLSKLSFKEIKKLAEISSKYPKIKPHWLNTMTLLLSILESNSEKSNNLLQWLIKSDPESVVRVEKDKLQLHYREAIFESIIQNYIEKEVFIRNGKYDLLDLTRLISDSPKVLNGLIDRLKISTHRIHLIESLEMIQGFDKGIIGAHNKRIEKCILQILEHGDLHYEIVYQCLVTLGNLESSEITLTKEIVRLVNLESSSHARTGFYEYLKSTSQAEDFIEVVLDGIFKLKSSNFERHKKSKSEQALSTEKYTLEDLIQSVRSESGLKRILYWLIENIPDRNYGGDNDCYFAVVQNFLKEAKATSLFSDFDFCKSVTVLVAGFSKEYHTHGEVNFHEYFASCPHSLALFKYHLEHALKENPQNQNHREEVYGFLFNDYCCTYILDLIRNENFTREEICRIRYQINWNSNRSLFETFHAELVKINDIFSYPKSIDPKELNAKRNREDCKLLDSKDKIIFEAAKIFKEENSHTLTSAALWDSEKLLRREDRSKNTLIFRILRDLSETTGEITISRLVESLEDKNRWEWYKIQFLYNLSTNNEDFTFDDPTVKFISNWVNAQLEECDFTNSVCKTENGTTSYHHRELFAAHFIFRLGIEVNADRALDLLNYPPEFLQVKNGIINAKENQFKVIDLIKERVGGDEVLKHISNNIDNIGLYSTTRKSFLHYASCNDKDVKVQEQLFKEIQGNSFQIYERNKFVDWFIDSNGDPLKLLVIVEHLDFQIQLNIIEHLVSLEVNGVLEVLNKLISQNVNIDQKYQFTTRLSAIDHKEASLLLIDWAIKYKRFPDRHFVYNDSAEVLDGLMFLYQDSLIHNYGDPAELRINSRNEILEPMINIASKSLDSYVVLRRNFNKWLDFGQKAKILHYKIEDLDSAYLMQISTTYSFGDAQVLIANIFPETRWQRFWRDRPLLDQIFSIVGYVLALAALSSLLFGLIKFLVGMNK